MRTYEILEVTNAEWLASISETRHVNASMLEDVGVPLRYLDLEEMTDREQPFTPYFIVSPKDSNVKAKRVLTDYIWAGANTIVPGGHIGVMTMQQLVDVLSPYNDDKRAAKKLQTQVDAVFVYDFGMFTLKNWEQKLIGDFLLDRYNNLKHIAVASENITLGRIKENVGSTIFDILTEYCVCKECA